MNVSGLDGFLWVAGFVGHIILFCILILRHRTPAFPFFTAFIGFSAARSVILFCLWQGSLARLYAPTYWSLVGVDTVLQFGLIWELVCKVFRRQGKWPIDIRGRLIAWSSVCVLVATCLTSLQGLSGQGWYQTAVLRANFFSAVAASELFVIMLVLSSDAGLNWRSHVAGIAMGFAVFSFVSIVIESVNNIYGFDTRGNLNATLQTARKELYLSCVAYWCSSLWRSEAPTRIMSPRMEGQVSALRDAVVQRNANGSE
jgi:hypothetical protein